MAEHKQTPWSWHAKSNDQAHNGSIYRMERHGHAYAIAMQPRYVDDAEFAANAAFIVKAVNNHEALVERLKEACLQIEYMHSKFDETGSGNAVLARINATLSAVGTSQVRGE